MNKMSTHLTLRDDGGPRITAEMAIEHDENGIDWLPVGLPRERVGEFATAMGMTDNLVLWDANNLVGFFYDPEGLECALGPCVECRYRGKCHNCDMTGEL